MSSFSADDDETVTDCINYAIAYIVGIVSVKYLVEKLLDAPLLTEFATIIAARSLTTRRGNPIPESLELRYQEIVSPDGLLHLVATGKIKLVDSTGSIITGKGGSCPTMSNLVVDRRFPTEQIRVKHSSSTFVQSKLERDSAFNSGVFDG